jgi:hypothetical protein
MPGRFELTSTLAKIWHARIIFASWIRYRRCTAGASLRAAGDYRRSAPSEDNSSPVQASREANLNLQSQSQPLFRQSGRSAAAHHQHAAGERCRSGGAGRAGADSG